MSTRRKGRVLGLCGAIALAIAIALLAAPTAGQIPEKALECNSTLDITFGAPVPATVMGVPGSRCTVTLTIGNGLSRDIADMAVSQDMSQVRHWVSCTSVVGGCTPDPALPVSFVAGSEGGTCNGGMIPAPMVTPGNGEEIVFDFGMPGFTLGPSDAMTGVCTNPGVCDCTITYDVFVPDSAVPGPGASVFPTTGDAMGECNIPGGTFTSLGEASASLTKAPVVPTLGAIALAALALTLLLGSWRLLRRRPLGGPAST